MSSPHIAIARMLFEEGAASLTDAGEAAKAALTAAYLDALDWDLEVTFNAREFRDAADYGQTWRQIVEAELYAQAENELGPEIEFELAWLRDEAARDIDRAIHDLKAIRRHTGRSAA